MTKRKRLMKAFVIIVLVGFILSSWILTMFMYWNNGSQDITESTQPNEVKYSWTMTGVNNTGDIEIVVETGTVE